MKTPTSLLLLALLPVLLCAQTPPASNRLKDKPEATAPAADDWLYLDGESNGIRKLDPEFFIELAATGARLHVGSGVPSDALGSNGDTYLRTGTGAFYLKASNTWGSAVVTLAPAATTLGGYGITDPVLLSTGSYADPAWITSLAKAKVGLSQVDNTADADKPISNATQTALNGKVDDSSIGTMADLDAPTYEPLGSTTAIPLAPWPGKIYKKVLSAALAITDPGPFVEGNIYGLLLVQDPAVAYPVTFPQSWSETKQANSGGFTLAPGGEITIWRRYIDGRMRIYNEPESSQDGDKGDITISSNGAAHTIDTGAVTAAKLAAALKPSGTAAAGDEALRALGTGAGTAAAGNDARLSDTRTPTDASVTAAKVSASLKPSGTASAGDEALRALGTGAGTAAAGNDARLTDTRTPTDGTVTTAKVAAATLVTAAEGIGSNNNDTTFPTSAAVKAYADSVAGGVGVTDGDKGDVVVTGSGATWTVEAATTSAAGKVELATSGENAAGVAVQGNDARLSDTRTPTDGTVTTTKIAAATLVTAAEGIGSNNNDTTFPTSAAVKAYADSIGGGSSAWGTTTGETDVASATTTDLGAVADNAIRITGTTPITGFGTVAEGTSKLVRFAGALTLTHNATSLILPGAANITTAAGDSLTAYSLGSGNWKVTHYTRQDGTPLAVGNLVYGTNAGEVTAYDMPVTSGSSDNAPHSYAFKIDGQTIFKVYAQSDGVGGVDNTRIEVNNGPLLTTLSAYSAGTAYALTNTAAALDFGTTDPSITITTAGTWRITTYVQLAYTGATVATETATLKLRRTNNTAADLSNSSVTIDLPVATTLTHTYGVVALPPVYYTTVNANDVVTIFGNVSAGLGAGTIDAAAGGTVIVAERLY